MDEPLEYEALEDILDSTRRRFGDAPTQQDVRRDLGSVSSYGRLERYLFAWEAEQPNASEVLADFREPLDWFEPGGHHLALLPTSKAHGAAAFTSYWGASGPGGAEDLVRILRSWHERFGAELVANWYTVLQFVVDRPPRSPEQAWSLVDEHLCIGQDLASSGNTPRWYVYQVLYEPTWLIHDHP